MCNKNNIARKIWEDQWRALKTCIYLDPASHHLTMCPNRQRTWISSCNPHIVIESAAIITDNEIEDQTGLNNLCKVKQIGSGIATCLTPKCMLFTPALSPAPEEMFTCVCSRMIKNCNPSMYSRIGVWLKSLSTQYIAKKVTLPSQLFGFNIPVPAWITLENRHSVLLHEKAC